MTDDLMRYLFIAIFCGFGLMMLYVGITQLIAQRTLISDPRRIAVTITRSEVVKQTSSDTDNRTLRSNSTTSYRPEIAFQYVIDGTPYTSELLKPTIISQSYASPESAASEISAFQVGAKVQAYYRPQYPDQAYLIREAGAGPIVFICIGLLAPIATLIACRYFV